MTLDDETRQKLGAYLAEKRMHACMHTYFQSRRKVVRGNSRQGGFHLKEGYS